MIDATTEKNMRRFQILNRFYLPHIFGAILMVALPAFITFGQNSIVQPLDPDKIARATTLINEGLELYKQATEESLRAALPKFEEARQLTRELVIKQAEAACLIGIGQIYSDLGENQKALDYFNQALPLLESVSDRNSQAIAFNRLGLIYSSLGDKQKALDYYKQSLTLSKAVGNRNEEANALNNIGEIFNDSDDWQKALDYHNQALLIYQAIGNHREEATALGNLGKIYSRLGDRQKALDFYNQALSVYKAVGFRRGEAVTLNNIGLIYAKADDFQKALDYYQQSVSLEKLFGRKAGKAAVLNNIGGVYLQLKEPEEALDYLNQALILFRNVGDPNGEATALQGIGAAYDDLGDAPRAIDYYNRTLPLRRFVNNKSGEAGTLNNLMLSWNRVGNRQLAIFYGKQAIGKYQELRRNIETFDKETQRTYLKTVESTYRLFTEILIAAGRLPEAQQVLNAFKDQQFFDFNRNPNEPIKRITQTPRETESVARYQQSIEQIDKISFEFNELKRRIGTRQLGADETAQLQKLESELKTATDAFLAVLKQAEAEFSKLADEKDRVGEISDTVEMQKALRDLNRQTGQKAVAVYTLVGEDNFRALIVSPDGIKAVSTPISATELNKKALKLWGLLQSERYDPTILSEQIYDVVLKPLEAELPKDTKTIMWSLDGNLRYLPMAALWDGKQYLVERYNNVNFTRADGERMTRAVNTKWTGTGFGSSNAQTVELLGDRISFNALPGVSEELRQVFKQTTSKTGILAGEVLPDKQFTKTGFLASLKLHRPVVHIASHFSFRPGDEERSFLLLGDGTAFTLNDMKAETNLFQNVDLLTLSACNTAATQADANGREVDGFAELAQRLGAGAVMATLWSVADNSTPALMKDFYDLKLNRNLNKAEALRQAQMALITGSSEAKPVATRSDSPPVEIVIVKKPDDKKQFTKNTRSDVVYFNAQEAPLWDKSKHPPFAHPFYWSPFVLIGNWR